MSFRFRKSVKLGKGVRLNVSKRGVGVSVGKRGLRHSIHSTGRRTSTVGIPGTGLSYMNTKTNKKKQQQSRTRQQTDSSENVEIVEENTNYLLAITNLHQLHPEPIDWEEVKTIAAPFLSNEMGPCEIKATEIYDNFQPNIVGRLFKNVAIRKENQLQQEIEHAKQKDVADYREWEKLTNLATDVLRGDAEAYRNVIAETGDSTKILGEKFQLNVDDPKRVEIELSVQVDAVIPKDTVTLTKTGKVSTRTMGKTKYFQLAKDHVSSRAISAARHLFACLPITHCLVHVSDNMLNTATGYEEDTIILSVLFDRNTINELNYGRINPSDAVESLPHMMDHLKTKGFRPVERISTW